MTFLRTVFLWTGVLTWYVLLVLAIARVLGHVSRDYPTIHDVDGDLWYPQPTDLSSGTGRGMTPAPRSAWGTRTSATDDLT
jgi:hypothetical protein